MGFFFYFFIFSIVKDINLSLSIQGVIGEISASLNIKIFILVVILFFMKVKITKKTIYKIFITIGVFWVADFLMHFTGIGESNYYYALKFANAVLLAFVWFAVFDSKSHWKKALFSIFVGTWISFSYLVTSYSGFIQWFGISARYSAPPFIVFNLFLSPYLWWVYHILIFCIGLEISSLVNPDN